MPNKVISFRTSSSKLPSKKLADQLINKHYFNLSTLRFLADKVVSDSAYRTYLLKIIAASKTKAHLSIAASNAISALNIAKVSFAGMTLSKVRIPYAVLDYANCHGTNFTGADLRGVSFNHAALYGTTVDSEQSPSVSQQQEIQTLQHSAQLFNQAVTLCVQEALFRLGIGFFDGTVLLYDLREKTFTHEQKAPSGEEIRHIGIPEDGQSILFSTDKTLYHWELQTNKLAPIRQVKQGSPLSGFFIAANGRIFVDFHYSQFSFCKIEAGSDTIREQPVKHWKSGAIHTLVFNQEATIACVYNLETAEFIVIAVDKLAILLKKDLRLHSEELFIDIKHKLSITPDSQSVMYAIDSHLFLLSLKSSQKEPQVLEMTRDIHQIEALDDGKVLVTQECQLSLWDTVTMTKLRELTCSAFILRMGHLGDKVMIVKEDTDIDIWTVAELGTQEDLELDSSTVIPSQLQRMMEASATKLPEQWGLSTLSSELLFMDPKKKELTVAVGDHIERWDLLRHRAQKVQTLPASEDTQAFLQSSNPLYQSPPLHFSVNESYTVRSQGSIVTVSKTDCLENSEIIDLGKHICHYIPHLSLSEKNLLVFCAPTTRKKTFVIFDREQDIIHNRGRSIHVMDLDTKSIILSKEIDQFRGVTWDTTNPDASRLLITCYNTLFSWDLASDTLFQIRRPINDQYEFVSALAFNSERLELIKRKSTKHTYLLKCNFIGKQKQLCGYPVYACAVQKRSEGLPQGFAYYRADGKLIIQDEDEELAHFQFSDNDSPVQDILWQDDLLVLRLDNGAVMAFKVQLEHPKHRLLLLFRSSVMEQSRTRP